MYELNMCT